MTKDEQSNIVKDREQWSKLVVNDIYDRKQLYHLQLIWHLLLAQTRLP